MWFFRVLETPDSRWVCRRGTAEYDRHGDLDDALAHIRSIAQQNAPARLFVHQLDGTVFVAEQFE